MANGNETKAREILEGTAKELGIVALCIRHNEVVDSMTTNPYFFSITLSTPFPRPNFVTGNYLGAIPEGLRMFDDELRIYCDREGLKVNYPTLRRIVVATPK